MKMAKKLLAVVLAGVMAVSMLTGCALGDAVSEKELLDKMNTFGAADNVKYAVEKKDGDFGSAADAREKAVKAVMSSLTRRILLRDHHRHRRCCLRC